MLSIRHWTGNFGTDGHPEYEVAYYDPNNESDQAAADAFILELEALGDQTYDWSPNSDRPGGWAVIGGGFSDDGVFVTGALTGALPDVPTAPPFDWMLAA